MDGSERKTPPYLSYKTLRNFLDSFRYTAMPARIDRSVMSAKSGSNQILLIAALRYLNLVTDRGSPTTDLQQLVKADGSERQKLWAKVIFKAYADLFDSGVDIERTTTQELAEAFAKEGVSSPDTMKKCVTFLSLAAKDAGMKLSPHVKPYAGRRRRSTEKINAGKYVEPFASGPSSEVIYEGLLSKFPQFDPSWPEHVRNNWLAAFEKLTKLTAPLVKASAGDSSLDQVR